MSVGVAAKSCLAQRVWAVRACVRKVAGARLYALRPLVLVATSAW